ncbi:MAG: CvpA family protein [Pseudomonadales bacterium]|nr:CvpA family protein [Pseudomonadales bacterium]
MEQLNWADGVIIGIIGISAVLSLWRGFVKEVLSLLTWIAAFFVARLFASNLETLLVDSISTPSLRYGVSFLILFVVTLLIGSILNRLVGQLIKVTGLTSTDRLLGMFFGLARGIVITIVMIALLRLTPLKDDPWWSESVMIAQLELIENWSREIFDNDIAPLISS